LDVEQTRIMTAADRADAGLDRPLHCLELIDGLYLGRRYLIARSGATIGRSAPADIVLAESEVSRAHCRITVEGDDLLVTDLKSTNGTFIDDVRVTEPAVLAVGAVLTVGHQSLRRIDGESHTTTAAPDIFLSYNREDQLIARRFADAFAALGFEVWWDVTLRAGQAYDEVTESALRGAKAVVVLWSKRSVASRWVRAEATLGDRNGTLLPAMIEECERPVMFELTQTANLSQWDGSDDDPAWLAFVEDVRRRIGPGGSGTESGR
jgi:hypothetical protein